MAKILGVSKFALIHLNLQGLVNFYVACAGFAEAIAVLLLGVCSCERADLSFAMGLICLLSFVLILIQVFIEDFVGDFSGYGSD